MLNEPRGGMFRHVNLLVPAKDPRAVTGWIIIEPADTPPMSGSNAMCVATVLLEAGMVAMVEPETRLLLEPPGGIVEVPARCPDGKIERLGTLAVGIAYGDGSFLIFGTRSIRPSPLPQAIASAAAGPWCEPQHSFSRSRETA